MLTVCSATSTATQKLAANDAQFLSNGAWNLSSGASGIKSGSATWLRMPRRLWPNAKQRTEGDSDSGSFPLKWDPLDNLYGLGIDMRPIAEPEPRPRHGPHGELMREVPCPLCRGRGYDRCASCHGVGTAICQGCRGSGKVTCPDCNGLRTVWRTVDPTLIQPPPPVEEALVVVEDEALESLPSPPPRKTRRVYTPLSEAAKAKISRALKAHEAKTNARSLRMKRVYSDPVLREERLAKLKAIRQSEAYRRHISQKTREYFQDPENRRKQSEVLKGAKIHCKACGQEGHRSNFCPSKGHTKRPIKLITRVYRCTHCGQTGHRFSNCPNRDDPSALAPKPPNKPPTRRSRHSRLKEYACSICGKMGHNSRTCPEKTDNVRVYKCTICGGVDHNRRTCRFRSRSEGGSSDGGLTTAEENV